MRSHEGETWRLFGRESWRMNKLSTTIYLPTFMSWRAGSGIRVNTRFQHPNPARILGPNIVTRLEYSVPKSWPESSLGGPRTRPDLDDPARRGQSMSKILSFGQAIYLLGYWFTSVETHCKVCNIENRTVGESASFTSKNILTIFCQY